MQENFRQKYGVCPDAVLSAEINSTAKIVYTVIASFYRPGNPTFPSYNRIAAAARISRRTAIRAVRVLELSGFVKKEVTMRPDGGNTTNRYTLAPQHLPSDADVTPPSDTDVTPPSDTDVTPKQRNFKNNKNLKDFNNPRACAREKMPADTQRSAEYQTDLEGFTASNDDFCLLRALRSSAIKAVVWLELVRKDKAYYLRPVTPRAVQYIDKESYAQALEFVRARAGGCQPLKYGQRLEREIVIDERL